MSNALSAISCVICLNRDEFANFADIPPVKKKKKPNADVEVKAKAQKNKHKNTKHETNMPRDGAKSDPAITEDPSQVSHTETNKNKPTKQTEKRVDARDRSEHSNGANNKQHKRQATSVQKEDTPPQKEQRIPPNVSGNNSKASSQAPRKGKHQQHNQKPKTASHPSPQVDASQKMPEHSKNTSHPKQSDKHRNDVKTPAHPAPAPNMKSTGDNHHKNAVKQHASHAPRTHKKKGDHKRHHQETQQEKRSAAEAPKKIGRVVVITEKSA